MEKVAKWYTSVEIAAQDVIRRYAKMSPLERLNILFSLINPSTDDQNTPRLERVARFIEIGKS